MKQITVIYWSGTGNTEVMAQAIADGAASAGGAAKLLRVEDASVADVLAADAIAFGCPSMGAEVLEEEFMEPFISNLPKLDLAGKTVGLFGSYDWGDGEWMRNWVQRMKDYQVKLIADGLIIRLAPDETGLQDCRDLGTLLAK